MSLCVVYYGRLVEFRVAEEGEQRGGDNVGSDHLFVAFGHSEFIGPYAGVAEEHVKAW